MNLKLKISGQGSEAIFNKLDATVKKIIIKNTLGPFADLSAFFSNVDIALLPAFYGSGIKNKILECSNFNIPVLVHESSQHEFDYPASNTIFFKGMPDLIKKINLIAGILGSFDNGGNTIMLKYRLQFMEFLDDDNFRN
jgi:hypothetical protein